MANKRALMAERDAKRKAKPPAGHRHLRVCGSGGLVVYREAGRHHWPRGAALGPSDLTPAEIDKLVAAGKIEWSAEPGRSIGPTITPVVSAPIMPYIRDEQIDEVVKFACSAHMDFNDQRRHIIDALLALGMPREHLYDRLVGSIQGGSFTARWGSWAAQRAGRASGIAGHRPHQSFMAGVA